MSVRYLKWSLAIPAACLVIFGAKLHAQHQTLLLFSPRVLFRDRRESQFLAFAFTVGVAAHNEGLFSVVVCLFVFMKHSGVCNE